MRALCRYVHPFEYWHGALEFHLKPSEARLIQTRILAEQKTLKNKKNRGASAKQEDIKIKPLKNFNYEKSNLQNSEQLRLFDR